MSSVYAPGSRRSRGKLYRPSASVVTLTWTIDLARRAVTTTPSILPSASELTRPVSAASPSARTALPTGGKTIAAAMAARVNISLARIGFSRRKLCGILPHFGPAGEREESRHGHTLLFGDFRNGDRPCGRHPARACRG